MNNKEIEIKYWVEKLPDIELDRYTKREIEQGYLCTKPTVRVRRDNEEYYLTYKGKAKGLEREEYNLPLTKEAYEKLILKCEGRILSKTRYEILDGKYIIELDIFHGEFEGLMYAEVEFENVREAESYEVPWWFTKDVSTKKGWSNASLCMNGWPKTEDE